MRVELEKQINGTHTASDGERVVYEQDNNETQKTIHTEMRHIMRLFQPIAPP